MVAAMTSPIDPIRGTTGASNGGARRDPDRSLPVPVESRTETPPPPPRGRSDGAAVFAAQLLGQDGQKRGLRAPGTVETAKGAYTRAEWSGRIDRRARKGRMGKTEI